MCLLPENDMKYLPFRTELAESKQVDCNKSECRQIVCTLYIYLPFKCWIQFSSAWADVASTWIRRARLRHHMQSFKLDGIDWYLVAESSSSLSFWIFFIPSFFSHGGFQIDPTREHGKLTLPRQLAIQFSISSVPYTPHELWFGWQQ